MNKPISMNILEIPIAIRIIGDPVLVANKIFEGKKESKTGKIVIPQSILVENDIECRLKEYRYQNEVDAKQDLLIVFGVIGFVSKSLIISSFLFEKLKDFRKTTLLINNQEVEIDQGLIFNLLENMRS